MWTRIGDDLYIPRISGWPHRTPHRVLPLAPVPGGYRVLTTPIDQEDVPIPGAVRDCGSLAGLLDGRLDALCTHCLEVFRCRGGGRGAPGFRTAAAGPSVWTAEDLARLQATRQIPSLLVLPRKHWRDGCLKPDVRLEFGQRALLAVLDNLLACNVGPLLEQRDFCRYLLACDGVLDDQVARDMARHRLQALRKALAEPPPARFRELVETGRL